MVKRSGNSETPVINTNLAMLYNFTNCRQFRGIHGKIEYNVECIYLERKCLSCEGDEH